jgi:two-component system, cell cycle sensor histidine kinase and response regulator CckA
VFSAARPREGVAVSKRYPGQIDLIITDVVMPEMAGPKLVDRIITDQPQIRVLYISGYADDEFVQRGLQQGSINFLQKPFGLPALLAKVRRVLDFTT